MVKKLTTYFFHLSNKHKREFGMMSLVFMPPSLLGKNYNCFLFFYYSTQYKLIHLHGPANVNANYDYFLLVDVRYEIQKQIGQNLKASL